MSCLLEKKLPFVWTLLDAENLCLEFPLNQITFALLDQNDDSHNSNTSEEGSDLSRIEHKVNLILQMLGHIMQARANVPEKIQLQLSADEIAWCLPDATIDQDYQLTLFLSEDFHLPLNLLVRVINNESGWCHARIIHQQVDEQTIWEKWVFRQHRRHIALARTHPDQ